MIRKGLTKYNTKNGIIPMKTHVDFVHLQLIVQWKLVLTNNVIEADHSRQLWKKRLRPSGSTIITFFWATTPYMKHNRTFLKIWCFIYARVIGHFPLVKMFG